MTPFSLLVLVLSYASTDSAAGHYLRLFFTAQDNRHQLTYAMDGKKESPTMGRQREVGDSIPSLFVLSEQWHHDICRHGLLICFTMLIVKTIHISFQQKSYFIQHFHSFQSFLVGFDLFAFFNGVRWILYLALTTLLIWKVGQNVPNNQPLQQNISENYLTRPSEAREIISSWPYLLLQSS